MQEICQAAQLGWFTKQGPVPEGNGLEALPAGHRSLQGGLLD